MRTLLLSAALLLGPCLAHGGNFGVAPTRLDFDRGTRTATIEVSSEDEQKLNFQVKLFEWSQTAEGRDEYRESQDLIWFPQIFAVNPNEKRIIRVGLKGQAPPPAVEKTYRLFIEEIPQPSAAASGAEVKVVIRFGVPLFVAPAVPRRSLAIDSVQAAPGKAIVRVRNDGTRSVKVEGVRLQRESSLVAEAQGWYVLAGVTRGFEIPVDPGKCPTSGSLEAVVTAEGASLKQPFASSPALCGR
jgi:fimbrial chaperone protein